MSIYSDKLTCRPQLPIYKQLQWLLMGIQKLYVMESWAKAGPLACLRLLYVFILL